MWILPTMSRTQQCAEIFERMKQIGISTPGILFVNGESHYNEYEKLYLGDKFPDNWIMHSSMENIGCIGALNDVLKRYPNKPWYGFLADDEFLFPDNPKDWDRKLIDAAGNWDAAHGWENINNGGRLQGGVVLGGDLVRTVGYLGLATTRHNFGFDSMWEWLSTPHLGGGGAFRIHYVPEVKFEHRHTHWDDCYKLGFSTFDEDRKSFADWQKNDMRLIAERIKKARNA